MMLISQATVRQKFHTQNWLVGVQNFMSQYNSSQYSTMILLLLNDSRKHVLPGWIMTSARNIIISIIFAFLLIYLSWKPFRILKLYKIEKMTTKYKMDCMFFKRSPKRLNHFGWIINTIFIKIYNKSLLIFPQLFFMLEWWLFPNKWENK